MPDINAKHSFLVGPDPEKEMELLQPLRCESADANAKTVRFATGLKFISYDIAFNDWEPNSLHWNTPSNMTIYNDGEWFLYARHLSNFRRDWGPIDAGSTWTALVNVTLFEGQNQSGSVVFSRDYLLTSVEFKVDLYDQSRRGQDSELARGVERSGSGTFTRWFR